MGSASAYAASARSAHGKEVKSSAVTADGSPVKRLVGTSRIFVWALSELDPGEADEETRPHDVDCDPSDRAPNGVGRCWRGGRT
jgi:hypothetical protein